MGKKPGITLIELVVTVAIGTVVAGVVTTTMLGAWKSYTNQTTISQLERSNRQAMTQIIELARGATRVVNAVTIGGTTYTSAADMVVLRFSPQDSNGNYLTSGDDYVVIRRRPGAPATTERLTLADPTSIRYSWPNPLTLDTYTLNFSVRYFNAAGTELTPNTDDLTTAKQLTFQSQAGSSATTVTQLITDSVFMRNKE